MGHEEVGAEVRRKDFEHRRQEEYAGKAVHTAHKDEASQPRSGTSLVEGCQAGKKRREQRTHVKKSSLTFL